MQRRKQRALSRVCACENLEIRRLLSGVTYDVPPKIQYTGTNRAEFEYYASIFSSTPQIDSYTAPQAPDANAGSSSATLSQSDQSATATAAMSASGGVTNGAFSSTMTSTELINNNNSNLDLVDLTDPVTETVFFSLSSDSTLSLNLSTGVTNNFGQSAISGYSSYSFNVYQASVSTLGTSVFAVPVAYNGATITSDSGGTQQQTFSASHDLKAGTYAFSMNFNDHEEDSGLGPEDLTSDANMQFTVKFTSGLDVGINDSKVVPTKAKTLNLAQFFGTEALTVAVNVRNDASAISPAGLGDLQIAVTTDGTNLVQLFDDKKFHIPKIKPNSVSEDINVSFEVPGNPAGLTEGTGYFLAATLTPQIKGEESPSTIDSNDKFEFVGTPALNPAFFNSGGYFKFISDTLKGNFPFVKHYGGKDPTTPASFIFPLEGNKTKPYLDGNNSGDPTIGVGIDLTQLDSTSETELAADVRSYYLTTYKTLDIANLTDDEIITMLTDHARRQAYVATGVGKITPRADISADQGIALLNEYLSGKYIPTTQRVFPGWASLSPTAYAAMVDLAYNGDKEHGQVIQSLSEPFDAAAGPDYVWAAFVLVDSRRSTGYADSGAHYPGWITRSEAEMQNLFGMSSSVASSLLLVPQDG